MICAVATTLNEADVIESTVLHLLDQGVERVLVADASTDGTRDLLEQLPGVIVYDDTDPVHYQPKWINRLAYYAYELGAEWVVPFDADEWWCRLDELHAVAANVGTVRVPMFHHYTWDLRELHPKPMGKVCFRAHPHAQVANGNHAVTVPGGTTEGLEIRELQYRGVDHFVRKVRERCATLDPALGKHEGTHHTRFRDYTDAELRDWYLADHPIWGSERTVIHDPIPSNRRPSCT